MKFKSDSLWMWLISKGGQTLLAGTVGAQWQGCSDLYSYCSATIHLFNWDELRESVFLSRLHLFLAPSSLQSSTRRRKTRKISPLVNTFKSGKAHLQECSLHWFCIEIETYQWDSWMADVHLLPFIPSPRLITTPYLILMGWSDSVPGKHCERVSRVILIPNLTSVQESENNQIILFYFFKWQRFTQFLTGCLSQSVDRESISHTLKLFLLDGHALIRIFPQFTLLLVSKYLKQEATSTWWPSDIKNCVFILMIWSNVGVYSRNGFWLKSHFTYFRLCVRTTDNTKW